MSDDDFIVGAKKTNNLSKKYISLTLVMIRMIRHNV
jgi:hypothetical protein